MLRLPKATELHKQLPKKALYAKFKMNTAAKEKIDADISRITIINEISPAKVYIAEGKQISSFFVVLVTVKRKDFDEKTMEVILKLIPQKMLLVLQYGQETRLAAYYKKLLQTEWKQADSLSVELKGLTLDTVWENIIIQVGNIQIESGNTLDEQIEIDDRGQKLEKEIVRLEKMARKENQPKKKFEIVQEINKMKKELEEI